MKDYCSAWPDSIDGVNYGQDCCRDHDEAYMTGGIVRKFVSDYRLMRCVWRKGKAAQNWYIQWNAVKMYLGVTFLGWPFWWRARK